MIVPKHLTAAVAAACGSTGRSAAIRGDGCQEGHKTPASANLFIIPAQRNYEEFNAALRDRREAKKYIHLYILCNLIAARGNNGKNFIEGHLSAAGSSGCLVLATAGSARRRHGQRCRTAGEAAGAKDDMSQWVLFPEESQSDQSLAAERFPTLVSALSPGGAGGQMQNQ